MLQYATWAGAAMRGDLGRSFKTRDPVASLILDRLGATLQLTHPGAPVMPSAPPMFSMTICWPSASLIRGSIIRAMGV